MAASKKPPAAANSKAAPKAAPKEASMKPTASDASKRTAKKANEQETRTALPNGRPSQDSSKNNK
jgi:hypothetical protein